jgi:hypothetical protein
MLIIPKKRGIIKNAIQTASNYYNAAKSNVKSDINIIKLANKYGIVEGVYGAKNFDTVIKKAKQYAKQGNMVGVRDYFKSQREKARSQGQNF